MKAKEIAVAIVHGRQVQSVVDRQQSAVDLVLHEIRRSPPPSAPSVTSPSSKSWSVPHTLAPPEKTLTGITTASSTPHSSAQRPVPGIFACWCRCGTPLSATPGWCMTRSQLRQDDSRTQARARCADHRRGQPRPGGNPGRTAPTPGNQPVPNLGRDAFHRHAGYSPLRMRQA